MAEGRAYLDPIKPAVLNSLETAQYVQLVETTGGKADGPSVHKFSG